MAITLHGTASVPSADSGSQAGPTVTVTPPASMAADDYVVVVVAYKASSTTINVDNAGGQTWTSETVTGTNTPISRMFHCRFNGTWTANPSFTQSTGGTAPMSARMVVLRGVDTTTAVDVAAVSGNHTAPATPFTVTISSITTVTDGAWAVVFWSSADDNTWGSLTAGWSYQGGNQIRNLQGTDLSQSVATKEITTAGATGAVSNNQATNGGDTGSHWIIALRPAVSGAITGTGGVAFGASLAGTAELKFIASGGVSYTHSPAGTAELKFIASGGTAFSASLSGTGTYTPLAITASGGVSFTASPSGTGAIVIPITASGGVAFSGSGSGSGTYTPLAITASGGVAFTHSPVGTAELKFIASGGVAFTHSPAGTAELKFIASGGVAFTHSPVGTAELKFIASGGVAYAVSISGTGVQTSNVVGSGAVSFTFSLAGSGVQASNVVGSGAVSFTFSLVGSGSSVFGNDRVGTGGVQFSVISSGSGFVLAASGSSMTLIQAMIIYQNQYALLTTELERRALQRLFVGRWGVYPVQITY